MLLNLFNKENNNYAYVNAKVVNMQKYYSYEQNFLYFFAIYEYTFKGNTYYSKESFSNPNKIKIGTYKRIKIDPHNPERIIK